MYEQNLTTIQIAYEMFFHKNLMLDLMHIFPHYGYIYFMKYFDLLELMEIIRIEYPLFFSLVFLV